MSIKIKGRVTRRTLLKATGAGALMTAIGPGRVKTPPLL